MFVHSSSAVKIDGPLILCGIAIWLLAVGSDAVGPDAVGPDAVGSDAVGLDGWDGPTLHCQEVQRTETDRGSGLERLCFESEADGEVLTYAVYRDEGVALAPGTDSRERTIWHAASPEGRSAIAVGPRWGVAIPVSPTDVPRFEYRCRQTRPFDEKKSFLGTDPRIVEVCFAKPPARSPSPTAMTPPAAPSDLICRAARRAPVSAFVFEDTKGRHRVRLGARGVICRPAHLSSADLPDVPFSVLRQGGEAATAMRTLWLLQHETPVDADHYRTIWTVRRDALKVVEAHRDASVRLLASAIAQNRDPRDLLSLLPLLEAVGPAEGLTRRLAALLPGVVETPSAEGHFPVELEVRWFVLDRLAGFGRAGSELARSQLLDSLADLDPRLLPRAIGHYYELSPRRRDAQVEMRNRLPAEHRYLLYQQ